MKPAFESVNASANSAFIVRKFNEKKFSAPYHFHPELELTFILKGKGNVMLVHTRMIIFRAIWY